MLKELPSARNEPLQTTSDLNLLNTALTVSFLASYILTYIQKLMSISLAMTFQT